MSSNEVVISASAVKAVPKDYVIGPSQEIVPLCITATVNGASAASAFYATVEYISDGGLVMGRFPCLTTVPAAGSADISWFPLNTGQDSTASQSAYEQLVLSNPHLRAYYKLDETSGTSMLDSGPLGINGSYFGGPTLGQPPLADVHAVRFSAASLTYGEALAAAGIVGTGEQSVACWVKKVSNPGVVEQFCQVDDNNARYFQFRCSTGGKVEYIIFNAARNAISSLLSATSIDDNAKHFVVGTVDSAFTQTIYVDGVQDAQRLNALPNLSTFALTIDVAGRIVLGPPVQDPLTGTLDEVAVYNWALTAAEVAALFAAAPV